MNELLRMWRRAADRKQACSLYWTLGGNQVGKAAISRWRACSRPRSAISLDVALWPFDGTFGELLGEPSNRGHRDVPDRVLPSPGGIADRSKRGHCQRAAQARAFRSWRNEPEIKGRVAFDESREAVDGGFGSSEDGEDPFDAFVGVLGMLNVLLGRRSAGWLEPAATRAMEGWILGQATSPAYETLSI